MREIKDTPKITRMKEMSRAAIHLHLLYNHGDAKLYNKALDEFRAKFTEDEMKEIIRRNR